MVHEIGAPVWTPEIASRGPSRTVSRGGPGFSVQNVSCTAACTEEHAICRQFVGLSHARPARMHFHLFQCGRGEHGLDAPVSQAASHSLAMDRVGALALRRLCVCARQPNSMQHLVSVIFSRALRLLNDQCHVAHRSASTSSAFAGTFSKQLIPGKRCVCAHVRNSGCSSLSCEPSLVFDDFSLCFFSVCPSSSSNQC